MNVHCAKIIHSSKLLMKYSLCTKVTYLRWSLGIQIWLHPGFLMMNGIIMATF